MGSPVGSVDAVGTICSIDVIRLGLVLLLSKKLDETNPKIRSATSVVLATVQ